MPTAGHLTLCKSMPYNSPMQYRPKYYHGLCGRYGADRVERFAMTLPVVLQLGWHFALRPAETALMTAANGATYGLLSGLCGVFAAMAAHSAGNLYASRHHYGLTRGAALVQKFQAAAYSLPVAGGLALALALTPANDTPPQTKTTTVTVAPPALTH